MLWTMDFTSITMDSLVHFMDGTPEWFPEPAASSIRHAITVADLSAGILVRDAFNQAIVADVAHTVTIDD